MINTPGRVWQLDIDQVAEELFSARDAISAKLAVKDPADSPIEFARQLVKGLDQPVVQDPLTISRTDVDVFKAAVRAIGSNARSWSTYVSHEARLAEVLDSFDPYATATRAASGELTADHLRPYFPGITQGRDARAVLNWAKRIDAHPHHIDFLNDVASALAQICGDDMSRDELFLGLQCYLAYPPARWEGDRLLLEPNRAISPNERKLPGMGYPLTAEFLRNLGWSGFKPDRHIVRLLSAWRQRWMPDRPDGLTSRGDRLLAAVGPERKWSRRAVEYYIGYGMLGLDIVPDGVPASAVDNLIWLLGAYAETIKSGRDPSAIAYLVRR